MIDARDIEFPARSRDVNALNLFFTTPTAVVRPLLVGAAYELVEAAPGTVNVIVNLNEYRSGTWGPCNTVDLCLPVRPAGATGSDENGLFFCEPLINRRFTGEVAYWSMGIARRYATVDVVHRDHQVSFIVAEGDEPTLEVRFPRHVVQGPAALRRNRTYSYLDGEPYVVPFDIDFPEPVVDPASVQVDVGEGRLADALRSLGLPRRADACSWGTGLDCTIKMPRPLCHERPWRAAAAGDRRPGYRLA
jgi:hypothetical protein